MELGRRLVVCVVVGFLVHAAEVARATAAESAAAKIAALNVEAMQAYKAGEPEMARTKLMEAVIKGKSGGQGSQAAMARTYMNLGVVHTDGLKDPEKGARFFAMALKLRPDIKVDAEQNSKTVAAAIEKATAANAAAAATTNEVAETAKSDLAAVERSIGKARPPEKKPPPAPAEAAPPAEPEVKAEAKPEPPKPPAAAPEAKPAPAKAAEAKPAPAPAPPPAKSSPPPAAASAPGPDPEKEKLKKEKAELEKQLAAAREGEKREREAKEKLAQEKAELEKQLAPLKDARDKAEKEKQVALAKEIEKKAQEEKTRQEKARLVDGPDMPSELPQALFCPDIDERPTGADMYVHCAAQPKLGAKRYAFHYRTAGASDYTTATMESTKKGWFMTMIPAAKVTGKTLQYYVEAQGSDGKVTASNGKAKSPSIMILLPPGSKPKAPAPAAAAAPPEETAAPDADEEEPAKAKATKPAKAKRKARTRASRRAPAKNG